MIDNDPEKIEEMRRPVSAFITFENEEMMLEAKRIKGTESWMELPINLTPAPEPTDIIWENRHFTK